LTSNETNYQENHIQQALKNNGYPSALTARSQSSTNTKKWWRADLQWELIFSGATPPYYRGSSEKLQRCLKDHLRPMRAVGGKLRNGKDLRFFDRQCAVYCTRTTGTAYRTTYYSFSSV